MVSGSFRTRLGRLARLAVESDPVICTRSTSARGIRGSSGVGSLRRGIRLSNNRVELLPRVRSVILPVAVCDDRMVIQHQSPAWNTLGWCRAGARSFVNMPIFPLHLHPSNLLII